MNPEVIVAGVVGVAWVAIFGVAVGLTWRLWAWLATREDLDALVPYETDQVVMQQEFCRASLLKRMSERGEK